MVDAKKQTNLGIAALAAIAGTVALVWGTGPEVKPPAPALAPVTAETSEPPPTTDLTGALFDPAGPRPAVPTRPAASETEPAPSNPGATGTTSSEWSFRWGWRLFGAVTPGEENPETPGYDYDGNVIVDPEVSRLYRIPPIHAMALYDIPHERGRLAIEAELFEFKVPKLGTFEVGPFVGEDTAGMHLSKRWVSVIDLSTGVWGGYAWDEDEPAFGVNVLVIKF